MCMGTQMGKSIPKTQCNGKKRKILRKYIYKYTVTNATGKSDNRNKRPRIHTINHTQRCFSLRPARTSAQCLHLANDLRGNLHTDPFLDAQNKK